MTGLLKRDGVYHVRLMVDGKRTSRSTGCRNLKDATIEARRIRELYESEKVLRTRACPLGAKDATIEKIIQLAEEAKNIKGCKLDDSTLRTYRSKIRQIAKILKVETVEQLRKAFMDNPDWFPPTVSEETWMSNVRNARNLFKKQRLKFYKQKGFDIRNPFAELYIPQPEIQPFELFPKEVADEIMERAQEELKEKHEQVYRALLLMKNLGLRAQEAAHLHWGDIMATQLVMVRQDPYSGWKPKNKKCRPIPLHAKAYEELISLRKPDEADSAYILMPLSHPGKTRAQSTLHRASQWLRKQGPPFDEAKNPNHMLRKYYGSRIAQDLDIYTASRYLGHSRIDVTEQVYVQLLEWKSVDV